MASVWHPIIDQASCLQSVIITILAILFRNVAGAGGICA